MRKGYRHAKKRPVRRRRYNKRKNYVNRVPKGVGPVAPRILTTMKYNEEVSLTSVLTGAIAEYQFNLNSLYDPNYTGTGHQPYGFDTLTVLYGRYRVYKCNWYITAEANDRFQLVVVPINGATTITDASLAAEMPHAMSRMYSIGGNAISFRGSSYLPRLGGDKRVEYKTEDRFAGQNAASPVEVMRLHLVANNTSLTTLGIAINVTLVYYCEFFDPFPLSQS